MELKNYIEHEEEKVRDPEAKDVFIRVLIGPEDRAENFHMRRFRVLPGGHTPYHAHDWEHEVYILSGRGELTTAEGATPFQAGDFVFVDPNLEHNFKNDGDEELVFLCLIPALNPK